MQSLERGKRYESFAQSLSKIAVAYGFSNPPIAIPRKALQATGNTNPITSASLALIQSRGASPELSQSWGSARIGRQGTLLSFAIFATKHAIAHALVVKTVVSIAELTGFQNISVLVSSSGDVESRKRFTRELVNFFKKNSELVLPEVRELSSLDPDRAYQLMLQ